jgi:hypothetical protein
MGLIADLGPGSVAVDTAVFIHFIEECARFLPIIVPLLREADRQARPCDVASFNAKSGQACGLFRIGGERERSVDQLATKAIYWQKQAEASAILIRTDEAIMPYSFV